MRGHSCGCREFAPQGKVAIRQTPYLPAEKKGEFRAAVTLMAVRLYGKLRIDSALAISP